MRVRMKKRRRRRAESRKGGEYLGIRFGLAPASWQQRRRRHRDGGASVSTPATSGLYKAVVALLYDREMDLAKNGRFFEAETIKSRTMARSQSAGALFGSYNELSGNSNAGGIHTFDVVKAKHRSTDLV
ncbi:hypothetical protein V1477_005815 [Vespula maculifrons]|uniref:Uncharacterized protein n=1 Tax=Vespula maculifrons TaxID=7453 RepID=A0ABD2CLB9_VESMC